MSLDKFCRKKVITVTPETSVVGVAEAMRQYAVGSVLVVSETPGGPELVGVVTDRDIVLEVVAKSLSPDKLVANDIMMRRPVGVSPTASLEQAAMVMKEHGIRRLPIVKEGNILVGIVTADDVVRVVAENLKSVSSVADRQIEKEKGGQALSGERFYQ